MPSRAGWRPLALSGVCAGGYHLDSPCAWAIELPQPARPSCPGSGGHLDSSWHPPPPPTARSLSCPRLVPPTCSRLLTSRAGVTMGWGCHSNQTGRHNPGMCAAPPPCRRAAGAAAATLGRLRDSRCGARWAERPGLGGCGQRRPRACGVETGGWRFGGLGGPAAAIFLPRPPRPPRGSVRQRTG